MKPALLLPLRCLQSQEVAEVPHETVIITADSDFEACGVTDMDADDGMDVVLPGKTGVSRLRRRSD